MDKRDQLSGAQSGFWKGKSTTDTVVSLVDNAIVEELEDRQHTVGVFLDYSDLGGFRLRWP